MIGAIIGDIVGSRFEWHNIKSKEFDLFTERCKPTDDSIMSLAIAKAVMAGKAKLSENAILWMQYMGRKYPRAGYGGHFDAWLRDNNPKPYYSFGNGSAMRVSACGFAAESLEDAKELALTVTEVTHNHPEGLKGAESVAVLIFLARNGYSKEQLKQYVQEHYYNMDFTLDEIRDGYSFDVSCQGTVPYSFEAFFESDGFEDAIRNAISIGGDSDTLAAITGGVAEAYYGVPKELREAAMNYLDVLEADILERFESRFPLNK